MAKIKVKLKGVSTEGLEALPEGWHLVRVSGMKQGKSKRSGKPKIEITFTVKKSLDEDGDLVDDNAKRKLFATASLQKQALFTLKRFLIATELYEDDEIEGELSFDTDDIVGEIDMWVHVHNEEYNSRVQSRVDRFAPSSLDPDELDLPDVMDDEEDEDDDEEEGGEEESDDEEDSDTESEDDSDDEDESEDESESEDDDEDEPEEEKPKPKKPAGKKKAATGKKKSKAKKKDEDDEDW